MADQNHTIFRERAIEKYMRRQDQHTVLRLAYPPVLLFLWPLLLLIFTTFLFVCSIQMPIGVTVTAMIVENGGKQDQTKPQIVVLLLFPPEKQYTIHHGQNALFCIVKQDRCMNVSLETEITKEMSPQAIRDQYQLPLALTVIGPSKVAIAYLEQTAQGLVHPGNQGYVTIQTGSESAFSLLSKFNHLVTVEKG